MFALIVLPMAAERYMFRNRDECSSCCNGSPIDYNIRRASRDELAADSESCRIYSGVSRERDGA